MNAGKTPSVHFASYAVCYATRRLDRVFRGPPPGQLWVNSERNATAKSQVRHHKVKGTLEGDREYGPKNAVSGIASAGHSTP